jgi:hypothetical protein
MKVLRIVLGVAIIAALAVSVTAARRRSDDLDDSNQEGWLASLANGLSNLNPFSPKLGHNWEDTQDKVENIYKETHRDAQRRVDALKDSALKDHGDLREKIASIYKEAAADAEERIDRLKRPILSFLRRSAEENEDEEDESLYDRMTGKYKDLSDKAGTAAGLAKDYVSEKLGRHKKLDKASLFKDTTDKISKGYHDAVNTATSTLGDISKSDTMVEAKAKLQKAYDEAFHKSHGESHGLWSRFKDSMMMRGAKGVANFGKSAMITTWHMVLHACLGVFWLTLGAIASTYIMWWWAARKFQRQLNSHVAGPVTLTQEFIVVGDEERQKKFYDYWTSVTSSYFSRQPGLRKSTLHRGVDTLSNKWFNVAEWSSVDDLRRATSTPEFLDIKRRAPVSMIPCQTLYQVSAMGPQGLDSGMKGFDSGVRHRTTAATGPGSS